MWEKVALGNLIKKYGGIIQTGPFGSQLHESDYSDRGIPVVMPKDIVDGKISEENIARVSTEIYRRLKRHRLNPGDIVLPRRGDFGKRAIITKKEQGWLCGTGCLKIFINPALVSPEYFFYYLGQRKVVDYIENQAIGSTMLNLSASIVQGFEVILPPLPIQRRIAELLGRYDTLIENYQRQIGLLEGMARELYWEWFVPGRCPYVQVQGHGIPVGWELVRFTDVISVLSGGTPKTSVQQYWDGDILWFSPSDAGNSFYIIATEKKITELGLKNCNSKLYPADTVVITARGTVGRCVLLGRPMAINQSNYALIGKKLSQFFVYFKTLELGEKLKKEAIGAVFETITVNNFENAEIILPPTNILGEFDRLIEPIFRKMRNCLEQVEMLRRMRDKLLTRLMSGELPFHDGEMFLLAGSSYA